MQINGFTSSSRSVPLGCPELLVSNCNAPYRYVPWHMSKFQLRSQSLRLHRPGTEAQHGDSDKRDDGRATLAQRPVLPGLRWSAYRSPSQVLPDSGHVSTGFTARLWPIQCGASRDRAPDNSGRVGWAIRS